MLTIDDGVAVRTKRFRPSIYIGDPGNAVRLWSDMCVDEIVCLDISERRSPIKERIDGIAAIVEEAFVPVSYGGGIDTVESARMLFDLGIEKIVLGWQGPESLSLLESVASRYGGQAVCCCIDYSRSASEIATLISRGKYVIGADHVSDIVQVVGNSDVGEVIIQCVDRDGTMSGFDMAIVSPELASVRIPLVMLGGAGRPEDVHAIHRLGLSAAAGSLYCLRGMTSQVLIGNPFLAVE